MNKVLPLFAVAIALAGSSAVFVGGAGQLSPKEHMDLVQGHFSRGATAKSSLKVLSWNIQYGTNFEGIAEVIDREKPDIALLQEVDFNARRSNRRNVAEELARRFGLNYVFGIEFEELGQGSQKSPAYHGQAILTAFPIRPSVRVFRFQSQTDFWKPHWYVPNWAIFQRRLGERMALVATIDAGGAPLVTYNTHLESRGSDRFRLEQLNEIVADVEQQPPEARIILAGDLNTQRRPSPLWERLVRTGFRTAAGDGSTSTTPKGESLDWIFVRGPIRSEMPAVHRDVPASDHFPLTVHVTASSLAENAQDAGR